MKLQQLKQIFVLLTVAILILVTLYVSSSGQIHVHVHVRPRENGEYIEEESKTAASSDTSNTFSRRPSRRFPFSERKFISYTSYEKTASLKPSKCTKWGVATTIFQASETIHRFVKLSDWCVVIVFDKKTPLTYYTKWAPGEGNTEVVLLYPDDQEAMKNEFVKFLPWNTFGRKNVGYLYAIMHGADVIWDFDDDNLLKFWIPSAAPSNAPSIDSSIPHAGGNNKCA